MQTLCLPKEHSELTMKANILETFRSIQGEGAYIGVTQVFLRFFECNMHCSWCDTPHSIGDTTRRYDEFSIEEMVHITEQLWDNTCHSVSVTGGEPLLQAPFLKIFLPKLKEAGRSVHLETNGILPEALSDVIDDIDVVAMDLKLPSSTDEKEFWEEHVAFLKIAHQKEVFVKTVISSKTTQQDVLQAVDVVAAIDPNTLFILQPNFFDLRNGVVAYCQSFLPDCLKKLKNVRIIPQAHKLLKVR